jgi:lipopolysaccharide/colanic/teichoic acid biosynthesis glycosyltransferase
MLSSPKRERNPTLPERPRSTKSANSIGKRAFDMVLASTLLALSSPVLAVAAIAIRLDSKGPILFRPNRVGYRGRVFTMYKLRTMFADAESRLAQLGDRNLGGTRLIRIPNDPRITRVGKLLRAASLDELPQFLNVIRGDMSMVGPRPQSPSEVAQYSERERGRLEVPQGLTGLWQVRARQSSDFEDWIKFDLEYANTWSIWLDLKILFSTPFVILRDIVVGRAASEQPARLQDPASTETVLAQQEPL